MKHVRILAFEDRTDEALRRWVGSNEPGTLRTFAINQCGFCEGPEPDTYGEWVVCAARSLSQHTLEYLIERANA